MATHRKSVTSNGVRVVSESLSSFRSVTIGVWVDVGSRDELPIEQGTCHFIEHMSFKGTRSRSSLEIAAALESLGGNINAFTSREQTCYYARVLDEHMPVAIAILSDILMNSTFTEENVNKERNVIIEEIKDVFDTPSEHVHDLFARALWNGHSLGHPIMGSSELISAMSRDSLLSFRQGKYTAGRMVVAAAGNVDHDELVGLVEKHLTYEKEAPVAAVELDDPGSNPSKVVSARDSSQTHICIGFPGYRYTHPNKLALLVLHNILGAGMSSRLFQAVREKLGFAYSVYTYQDFFKDCGLFCVAVSTDNKNAVRCSDVILGELKKIQREGVPEKDLEDARQQLKGNLVLGLEGTSSRMNRLARHELGYNRFITVEETLSRIESITADDIRSAVNDVISPNNCAAAYLGPVDDGIVEQVDWDMLSS
jgi:predicted Zn-dependent peptidase